MTAGTGTYKGLAVPLFGGATMESRSTSIDILTMDLAASGSEDFVVFRNNAGSELSYINSVGALNYPGAVGASGVILGKTGTGQTTFAKLRLPILATAPASAGLTKGDLWLAQATTDVFRLAMCISTATGAPRYGHRITRTTIGTASH
jgi:hypothetical protein